MQDEKSHYVSVTGIVVRGGRYLIARRSSLQKSFPGKWTVPGGKLEKKDYLEKEKDTAEHWYNVLEHALRREVREETGLEIGRIKYLTSLAFMRPEGIPSLVISLYAEHASGDVKLNSELTDHAWVSLEEARNYDLIEGIFEEIEMLDSLLKGSEPGEWGKGKGNEA